MSDKKTLKEQITKIKSVLASPKTDGTTRKILESGLKKAESKLEELEKAEKLESSNKDLTSKQEAKIKETKKESKSLADALKEKVKKAKQKIETTKSKTTTKKGGARSVARAKELAKEMRSKQKKQSLADSDIESDANRYAISKTKRTSHGGRANQYGTKAENKGGTYYEKRENRYDRQNKRYAKLEKGGEMYADGGSTNENYVVYGVTRVDKDIKIIKEGLTSYKSAHSFLERFIDKGLDEEFDKMGVMPKSKFEKEKGFLKYADGGTTMVGGTEYSSTDLSGMFAEGGTTDVDKELILSSAKNIYDKQGMMSLRNTFLQLANTDEKNGDIATANFRREVVKDYQSKQPRMFAKGGMTEHGLMVGDTIVGVSDDPYSIIVNNGGLESEVNLNDGTRESSHSNQGTRFKHSKDPMVVRTQFEEEEFEYAKGGEIGDSGIITDKKSLFMGKMGVIVGEFDNMWEVKIVSDGNERVVLVSKRGIDIVKDEDEYAKGGGVDDKGITYKDVDGINRVVYFKKEGNKLTFFEPIREINETVAYINDSSKIVTPASYYVLPNPIAKAVIKWSKKNGYEFEQDDKKYALGGTTMVGGTEYSSTDLSGMFKGGGMISVNGFPFELSKFIKDNSKKSEQVRLSEEDIERIKKLKEGESEKFFVNQRMIQVVKMAKGGSLKGDQYKLDLNKNGRLDKEDFKMLRGEKMAGGGVIYLESVGTYFRPSDLMTSPSKSFYDEENFRLDEIENDEWFEKLSAKDRKIVEKYFDISKREYGKRYADGGDVNRELNLFAKEKANELGITRKKLGSNYSLNLIQSLIEGLTDSNYHSEARKIISILEKKPEWAKDPFSDRSSVPEFNTPEYEKWREKSVFSSKYYDADEDARTLGIEISQKSGWDGYDVAMAYKYLAQMNGEQKIAEVIDKVFNKKMAKGGKVKFKDKVKTISKSLLKRKKVPKSVQKDYGKTFNKEEALDSARRIAGAMRKKEMAKKKR